MRAAARCKEGRTLLQTTFQPAVDSLLAERLVSSALAGPSTASSLVQLAQRTVSTQPGSSVGGLSRLYSTVARRNASLWNSAGVGPSQQVCHRSLLARAGAAGLHEHLFQISVRHWSRMLHSHVSQSSSLCVLHPGKCSSAADNTALFQQRTSTQRYLLNSRHLTCAVMVLCCLAHSGLWSVIVIASFCLVSRL